MHLFPSHSILIIGRLYFSASFEGCVMDKQGNPYECETTPMSEEGWGKGVREFSTFNVFRAHVAKKSA